MAAIPMIDKKEDTPTRSTDIKKIAARSTPAAPRRATSSSSQRFQETSKHIISTSITGPSTGMHSNAPTLPSSESTSASCGKVRRHSSSSAVACATDDMNRRSSCYAAQSSNTAKVWQNLSPAGIADDVNHHRSHHGTSISATSHGHYGHIASKNRLKHGLSLPSSSRFLYSSTSSSNHAFARPTSLTDSVDHGSSHPTSSKKDLTCHDSLQPAVEQGDDTNFANQGNCLIFNGGKVDDVQMHSECCMTELPLSNPNIGSTALQGKSARRNQLAITPNASSESRAAASKAIRRATIETYKAAHAGIRDSTSNHRTNELCKDCKARIMESVCFITNDGRISAAITGASYARYSHHCNVQGCAGNRHYYRLSSQSSKKDSPPKRRAPLNSQTTGRKSYTSPITGDHYSTASPVQGDGCSKQEAGLSTRTGVEMSSSLGSDKCDVKKLEPNSKEASIKCSEGDESCANADPLCGTHIDQNRFDVVSPCKVCSPSPSVQAPQNDQSCAENSHAENVEDQGTLPALYISSDAHDNDDGDDEKASAHRDAIQALNDFKSFLYHGDNEYSCSEDGSTEATTTPNSLIKGAFEDSLNIDIVQSNCEKELPRSRRSAMARMRQKYLESLREQEAETVRLRKQEIMARKQAGDWMLDCHMEELLHRLAPNGEARVKVLVEAFETVMNQSDSESSQTGHHQDQEHAENLHSYVSS